MKLHHAKLQHIGNISTRLICFSLVLIVAALSIKKTDQFTNRYYLTTNNSIEKHNNSSKSNFQNLTFCPKKSEINSIPKTCLQTKPEFLPAYNSSFYPIYPPWNPGPSEQTQGLKQIVLAAILLRKSLTISNFTSYRHDILSKKRTIPMGLRVDLEKLCQIVELKDLQILQTERKYQNLNNCLNLHLDKIIIVNERRHYFEKEKNDTKNYLEDHSMFSNDAADNHFSQFSIKNKNLAVLPSIKYKNTKYGRLYYGGFEYYPTRKETDLVTWFSENSLFYRNSNRTEIIGISHPHNWIFDSIHNLVDPGGAYRARNPVEAPSKPLYFTGKQAIDNFRIDKNLLYKVYRATSHPKFIVNLAKQFIETIIGTNEKFVGIHFRFTIGDFVSRNSMKDSDENMIEQNGVSPEYLLHVKKSLLDFSYFFNRTVSFFNKNSEFDDIQTIFIASPPSVVKHISKVLKKNSTSKIEGQIFGQNFYQNYRIFTTADTQRYLKNKEIETNCWAFRDYFGDVLSTLEKELMVQAQIFIRTRPSNWSFNVQGHRNSEGYQKVVNDRVIYDVFKNK